MVAPALPVNTVRVATAAIKKGVGNAHIAETMGKGGIMMAVTSSAINKSAGATNRMNDVKNEPDYVKRYVRNRELLNIGYSILANTAVQVFLHKPIATALKGKVPEGYVRMMLTAPGLYLSEYMSRLTAGKSKIEARQAHDKGSIQSAIRRAPNVSFASFSPSVAQAGFNASV
jgi:hypothetical protein